MATLKQNNSKDRTKIILYIFLTGILFNILWVSYVDFTRPVLSHLGVKNTVKVRDILGPYGYIIILSVFLFTLIYYLITRKRIYAFYIIIITSIIFIFLIPLIILLTTHWG
jgi:hypothetical protein